MAPYYAARSYRYALPAQGAPAFDNELVQEILEPSDETRTFTFLATLTDANFRTIFAAPAAAGIPIATAFIGFNRGAAAQALPGATFLLPPDVLMHLLVPPRVRVWANFRGDDRGATYTTLVGGFLILSVTATTVMEPAADGQSRRIVEGFGKELRAALKDFGGSVIDVLRGKKR